MGRQGEDVRSPQVLSVYGSAQILVSLFDMTIIYCLNPVHEVLMSSRFV